MTTDKNQQEAGGSPKYPSNELIFQWGLEVSMPERSQHIARKACDWQRERDALICYARAEHNREQGLTLFEDEARACGSAIRAGASNV